MTSLAGTTAVVTGATRGLGHAAAKALAARGASVVINGRTEDSCRRAVKAVEEAAKTRGRVAYVAGNVADESVADALASRCVEEFGCLDFVLNNAGLTRDKSLLKMSASEFDEVIAVHLRGTWLMCRAAARIMASSGGAILNVTSGSALFGLVGQSNYAAAKGGIIALTRALAVELDRYHIRVNALYPVALTDMTAPILEMSRDSDDGFRSIFGDPDDVARIIVQLADPKSTLNAQIIAFDGTEMTLWSHPDQIRSVWHSPPWADGELLAELAEVARQPAPLHPDRVGRATREALGNRGQTSRRRSDSK